MPSISTACLWCLTMRTAHSILLAIFIWSRFTPSYPILYQPCDKVNFKTMQIENGDTHEWNERMEAWSQFQIYSTNPLKYDNIKRRRFIRVLSCLNLFIHISVIQNGALYIAIVAKIPIPRSLVSWYKNTCVCNTTWSFHTWYIVRLMYEEYTGICHLKTASSRSFWEPISLWTPIVLCLFRI